ncbi:hypothetical protein C2W62_49385 [Candidatus Entotheonella serta]|nr:hypothetical protein C2W62_49385 [Candidatus Entotheonella serta]
MTYDEANALGRALEISEPPAPILPSVWRRQAANSKYLYISSLGQSVLDTCLNIGMILFVIWAAVLVWQHPR